MAEDFKDVEKNSQWYQLYAYRNVAIVEGHIDQSMSDVQASCKIIFRDASKIYAELRNIERHSNPEAYAQNVAKTLADDPGKYGKLNGSLLAPGARQQAKQEVDALAKKIVAHGDLAATKNEYEKLWKMAVDAKKMSAKGRSEKLQIMSEHQDYSDTMRDTRIKDREKSPFDEGDMHLDKGLKLNRSPKI